MSTLLYEFSRYGGFGLFYPLGDSVRIDRLVGPSMGDTALIHGLLLTVVQLAR